MFESFDSRVDGQREEAVGVVQLVELLSCLEVLKIFSLFHYLETKKHFIISLIGNKTCLEKGLERRMILHLENSI